MKHTDAQLADEGKVIFTAFAQSCQGLGIDDPEMTESDRRVKFIDPIFRDALGWRESEIHREEPIAGGFADYTFGTEYRWFHVEAKRTLPRFRLHIPSRKRSLKLSSTHLLGNKHVKPLIEQTARYSSDLGTEFAILTQRHTIHLIPSNYERSSLGRRRGIDLARSPRHLGQLS